MKNDNQLISLIYRAAVDTDSWYPLLDLLGEKLTSHIQSKSGALHNQEEFNTWMSHLQNALRLSEKDHHLQSERDTLAAVLNQLPIAVIIVRPDGFVFRQNERAKKMLAAHHTLRLDERGHICVCNQPLQTKTLQKTIHDIATSPEYMTQTLNLPLTKATIALAPAAAISESIAHEDHLVSLFIASVDVQSEISLNWLQKQYSLTRAEARLTKALVTHTNNLTEAAETLHISKETARSYLKNIFTKLCVHSQIELIKKVRAAAPVTIAEEGQKPAADTADNTYTLKLSDGRTLAYSIFGALDGYPVFVFHPFSGSRLLVHPDHTIARHLGVRLISMDRPGFGGSDPLPNRGFLDCATDIAQLADHLNITHFSLLGYSGGCPYALATAHALPTRVERLALVSCMSPLKGFSDTQGMHPLNRLTIRIAQTTPSIAHQCIRLMLNAMHKAPEQYFSNVTNYLASADTKTINRPEILATYISAAQEAMAQGGAAIADEILLFIKDWDFNYTDIQADTCFWHGNDDRHIPIHLGKRMASALPNCKTMFYDKLGYYIYFDKWAEILGFLAPTNKKQK